MLEDRPRDILDKACREEWLARQIRVGLASQIRAMRAHRGWTQENLATRCGMAQESISLLEDPERSRSPSLRTLNRIAAALDCAFVARFAPWSCLLAGKPFDWTAPVPSFDEEVAAGVFD